MLHLTPRRDRGWFRPEDKTGLRRNANAGPAHPASAGILQDHVRRLFSDHDDRLLPKR
jgi:hypothetical protein